MKIYQKKWTGRLLKSLLLITLAILGSYSYAQETKTVTILNADKSTFNRAEDENMRKFIGNVAFEIDSTILHCDTAFLNDESKDIDAYGNIHIEVNDTLNIYGDILNYKG